MLRFSEGFVFLEKKLPNFCLRIPRLRQKSWKWMKCIPNVGSKKKFAGSGQPSIETKSRLFPVFWGWFDGEKTGEYDLQCGSRSCDDGSPYTSFVPPWKHILSKAQTFTGKGYHSLTRHFLARLRRKSKCYSQCKNRLELSMRLLMQKRNSIEAVLQQQCLFLNSKLCMNMIVPKLYVVRHSLPQFFPRQTISPPQNTENKMDFYGI